MFTMNWYAAHNQSEAHKVAAKLCNGCPRKAGSDEDHFIGRVHATACTHDVSRQTCDTFLTVVVTRLSSGVRCSTPTARAALQNWRDSEPRGFFESSPPERQRIIAGHRELWAECVAEIDASPDGTTEWGSVSDAE